MMHEAGDDEAALGEEEGIEQNGIMGKGIANPIGSFWTGVMLLEHLGQPVAAKRLMTAIEHVTAAGDMLPADLGGTATTRQVTDAVLEALRVMND